MRSNERQHSAIHDGITHGVRSSAGKELRMQRLCTMLLVLMVCFSTTSTVVFAQPHAIQGDGQDYIVKPGDSLVKIATAFYGQARAWHTIFDATNAKAASDPS